MFSLLGAPAGHLGAAQAPKRAMRVTQRPRPPCLGVKERLLLALSCVLIVEGMRLLKVGLSTLRSLRKMGNGRLSQPLAAFFICRPAGAI